MELSFCCLTNWSQKYEQQLSKLHQSQLCKKKLWPICQAVKRDPHPKMSSEYSVIPHGSSFGSGGNLCGLSCCRAWQRVLRIRYVWMSKWGLAQLGPNLICQLPTPSPQWLVNHPVWQLTDRNNYVFILSFDLFWRFCKRASHLLDSLEWLDE